MSVAPAETKPILQYASPLLRTLRQRTFPWCWAILALLLFTGFLLRLNHLGQPGVKDLDEVFHALVARSMMDNPLHPRLYEHPYLPFDYTNWLANSTWLHKPPVAMWQMAISMAFFGESNFSMRLPSLLLSTASVALTFLIGRSLGDPRAGLFAAFFQALSPAITRLTHGQVFSDHIDIALLFYCELAVFCLIRAARTGSDLSAFLAGGFLGLAYLSKSFPSMFVLGLAIMILIGKRFIAGERELSISGKQLKRFIWATLAVALPWTFWCWFMFPREFAYEQLYVFQHLTHDIEAFAGPWDRLLFDYLFRAMLDWYPLALVSLAYVGIDGWRSRDTKRLFLFFWALGVLVPHLLAVSKTPSATLIGWPALWLAMGVVLADATRGRRMALGFVVATGVLLIAWAQFPPASPIPREGLTAGKIMLAEWRVLAQVGIIAAAGALTLALPKAISPKFAIVLLIALLAWPAYRHGRIAYLTSDDRLDAVSYPVIGPFVREKAPPEAVFFVENLARHEHLLAMWWLDRTCYPLRPEHFDADIEMVLKHGGTPFVLSRAPRAEPVLISVPNEGNVYRLDRPHTQPPTE